MDVGPLEIALIVVAIVLIFGVGKLGQIGGALGKSVHDFRVERDKKDDLPETITVDSRTANPIARLEAGSVNICPNCSNRMSENARFCTACGTRL
jgi:sec-independent protein translocase protein TatA